MIHRSSTTFIECPNSFGGHSKTTELLIPDEPLADPEPIESVILVDAAEIRERSALPGDLVDLNERESVSV